MFTRTKLTIFTLIMMLLLTNDVYYDISSLYAVKKTDAEMGTGNVTVQLSVDVETHNGGAGTDM